VVVDCGLEFSESPQVKRPQVKMLENSENPQVKIKATTEKDHKHILFSILRLKD
jgi:hypothetical protein